MPFVLIKANTKKGYEIAEPGDYVNMEYPNSKTRRGRVGHGVAQTLTTSNHGGVLMIEPINTEPDGTCRTIKAQYYKNSQANFEHKGTWWGTGVKEDEYIRKLTPKECFRLQGFDDEDYQVLKDAGISNTQIYKMAGNSITVNVIEFLFCQMFDDNNEIWL